MHSLALELYTDLKILKLNKANTLEIKQTAIIMNLCLLKGHEHDYYKFLPKWKMKHITHSYRL